MVTSKENIKMSGSANNGNRLPTQAASSVPFQVTSGLLSLKHGTTTSVNQARDSYYSEGYREPSSHSKSVEYYPEDQPSPVSSEEQAARGFTFPEPHFADRRPPVDRSLSPSPPRPNGIPRVPLMTGSHGNQPVLTPVTRFLTKESYGFVPRASSAMAQSSEKRERRHSSGFTAHESPVGVKLPSLRIRSLSVSQQPLPSMASCKISSPSSSRGCNTVERPRTSSIAIPSFNPSSPMNRPAQPLPSLPSITSNSNATIGGPFRYQRSISCPSDAMTLARSENGVPETRSIPPMIPIITPADYPKNRLERSSSVDGFANRCSAFLSGTSGSYAPQGSALAAPIEDRYRWFGASNSAGLESLAESAVRSSENVHPASRGSSKSFHSDAKREKKQCAFENCTSNAVTRGLCISHGGGRRCQRKGCTRGAQSKGLCVAHGGGRICREKGCNNIQRSMGLCIRHGGGKRCSVPGCQKGVVRQDLCTAHGGKRKCKVEDCNKHVKKKGLCRSHANSFFGTQDAASKQSSTGDVNSEMEDVDSDHLS